MRLEIILTYLCLLHLKHRCSSHSLIEMLIMGFHYSYLDLGLFFSMPQCAWDSSTRHEMKTFSTAKR